MDHPIGEAGQLVTADGMCNCTVPDGVMAIPARRHGCRQDSLGISSRQGTWILIIIRGFYGTNHLALPPIYSKVGKADLSGSLSAGKTPDSLPFMWVLDR